MKISVWGAIKMFKISDAAIVHIVNNPQEPDTDDITPKVSHSDGLKAIDSAIAYIEHQEESTPLDLLTLQRWRYIAATKRGKTVVVPAKRAARDDLEGRHTTQYQVLPEQVAQQQGQLLALQEAEAVGQPVA
ncbi:hypothetical protein J6590_080881 [Homalodisca vitripennis]|nr:hypothetical protein J6590_080881 [Homalodisca vitripennis]